MDSSAHPAIPSAQPAPSVWPAGADDRTVAQARLPLILLLALAGLDTTMMSTALPTMAKDLGGADIAAWVFTAYLIVSTCVIPLYGKLADRLGARTMLMVAGGFLVAGSLACALAPSMPLLIAARALQGLGGGGMMTLSMLTMARLRPGPAGGANMAQLGAAYALSSTIGPLLGAFIVQWASWRLAFWVAAPLAFVALLPLRRLDMPAAVHGVPGAARPPFDWAGAVLLVVALAALMGWARSLGKPATAVGMGQVGWLAVAIALAAFAAWVWVERRATDPVVPPSLFALRPMQATAANSALAGVAMFAAIVFMPTLLQTALHLSPVSSALHLLPMMLGVIVASQSSGLLLRTRGASPRGLGRLAFGLMLLAYAFLAWVLHAAPTELWLVSLAVFPIGLSTGLLFPVLTVVAQVSAPPRHMGVATAMPMMLRALGGALGVALLGALFRNWVAQAMAGPLRDGHSASEALTVAMSGSLAQLYACVAVACLLGVWAAGGWPERLAPPKPGPIGPGPQTR